MQYKYYEALHNKIINGLDVLSRKYDINKQDIKDFVSHIELQPHEQCSARKQDGQQCSRRHKLNEKYCGKHMNNLPFGVYNGNDMNLKTNTTNSSTKKNGQKQSQTDNAIVLKSVCIQNKYYYIDCFNILYNPEPINGCYEVIGKLNHNDNGIYHATSLITT